MRAVAKNTILNTTETPIRPATIVHQVYPGAVPALLVTQVLDTFASFGIRSLLVLYLVHHFSFGDIEAYALFSGFMALTWVTPVLGGVIADQGLGAKRSFALSLALSLVGAILFCFDNITLLYPALGFLAIGSGLFRPNLATLLGRQYTHTNPHRSQAFQWQFIANNLGAFLAVLICGKVVRDFGWSQGFYIAAGASLLSIVINLFSFREWGTRRPVQETPYVPNIARFPLICLIFSGVALATVVIQNIRVLDWVVPVAILITVIAVSALILKAPKDERRVLRLIALTFVFVLVFDIGFEQKMSLMNLFIDRLVDRTFFGFTVPVTWFFALDPFFVVLIGPLLVLYEKRLGTIRVSIKLISAVVLMCLGLLCFATSSLQPGPSGLVSAWWVICAFALHSCGEVMILPTGLSLITSSSPKRYTGTFLGLWFLSISFASYGAGFLARFVTQNANTEATAGKMTLAQYGESFGMIFGTCLVGTLILMIFIPWINSAIKKIDRQTAQNEGLEKVELSK